MKQTSKYLCQCKAVIPKEIIRAIKIRGAQSLLDVQNITKASTGCGRCKDQLVTLITEELKKIEAKGKQLRLDF